MHIRQSCLVLLFFVFATVTHSQSGNSTIRNIPIDHTNKFLYLNGSNYTLIDNALRCFKLESIGNDYDSLIRYWYLFPQENRNDEWALTLKMIELGESIEKKVARVYTLNWHTRVEDSLLEVSSIQVIDLVPKSGWDAFDKKIINAGLHTFQEYPIPERNTSTGATYGLSILQCLSWPDVKTIDFMLYGNYKKDLAYRKLSELKILIAEEFNGSFYPLLSDEELKQLKLELQKNNSE